MSAMVKPYKKRAYAKRKRLPRAAPMRAIRGHGAYTYGDKKNMGPFEKVGRYVGSALGSSYAGKGGGVLGEKLGSYLHYIGKIFGSGDYITSADQVKYNVLVNDSQIPQFVSSKNTVHIRHREFLGDILSSSTIGAFNIQNFSINPGVQTSFPWLSQVCGGSFQQYRINGMVFEYRTMSADALNSTNTALGSVIMATDYDSTDSLFTSKSQMENTEFGVSCKPSHSMIHAIECARTETSITELYVRNGAPPANADQRLYDLGRFSIATTGFQAANINLGELWVSYDVTLFKSVQKAPGILNMQAHYQIDPAAAGLAGGIGSHPIVPLTNGTKYDTIGLSFDATGHQLIFPLTIPLNSIFQIFYECNGANNVLATATTCTLSGGMIIQAIIRGNNSGRSNLPSPGPSANTIGSTFFVKYVGGGTAALPPTVTFVDYVAPTTPTFSDLIVTQMNGMVV